MSDSTSTTTSTASLSTIRLGGMASGLDTESVIEVMVQYKQNAIDNLQEKYDSAEELYGVWTEIDTAVSMLKVNADSLTSYTNWSQKTLESTDSDVVSGTVSTYGGASVGSYKIDITTLAQASRYNSDAQTSTSEALGWAGVFSVNGQEITVEADDTLTDIVSAVNDVNADMTGVGVTASIIGNKLVFTADETGVGNDVTISYVSGDDVLTNLGMFNDGNHRDACDLEGTVDGISVTSSTNTGVTDLITGVTLNFTETGSSTISVKRDTENIKTLISEFITSYNTFMEYLDSETSATVNSDGAEVSSTGLLQGDSTAYNIGNKARWILTQTFADPNDMDADYNSLYKVGIWTSDETNQISIVDEDKLDDALENHYDEIMALFRSYGDSDGNGTGVFRQLSDYFSAVTDPTEGSIAIREDTLNSKMTDMSDRIAYMKVKLIEYESSLWVHFSAMETSVSSINSQGTYVLSSLGISSSDS